MLRHTRGTRGQGSRRGRQHPLADTSAKGLRAPALAAVQPGVVVVARVPYAEGAGSKTRPAVVVRTLGRTVEILAITSSPRRAARDAIEVRDWAGAGLSRPSGVARSPVVLDRNYDVVCVLGRLGDEDWSDVSRWFDVVEDRRMALV